MKIEIIKELLETMYLVEKLSIPQIAQKLNVGKMCIYHKIKKFGIPTRSLKEALTGLAKSESHRKNLGDSKRGNKNCNFGKKCSNHSRRCWYVCPNGQTVSMRSQWEVWYAEYLRENKIEFEYEPKTFIFKDGSAYTPDFYLINSGEYVEVKGWLTQKHKKQIDNFKNEYDLNFILANKKYLESLGINLKKKWINSKPKFNCEKCDRLYHRSYPAQRFCCVVCRNKNNNKNKNNNEISNVISAKRKYKGKQSGENNNSSKVKLEQVLKARELDKLGNSRSKISEITGISPGNLSNILRYKSWRNV